jgi:hypothetical protein
MYKLCEINRQTNRRSSVIEPEFSETNAATGYDLQLLPSASHPHNPFPYTRVNIIVSSSSWPLVHALCKRVSPLRLSMHFQSSSTMLNPKWVPCLQSSSLGCRYRRPHRHIEYNYEYVEYASANSPQGVVLNLMIGLHLYYVRKEYIHIHSYVYCLHAI